MNVAHVHLLLNHFPTIGMLVAFALYLGALFRNHEDLKKVSLAIFFLISLIVIPTYMSGVAVQGDVAGQNPTADVIIKMHGDAALLAFIFMEITGVVAWFALWFYRRHPHSPDRTLYAVLVLGAISFLLMARAANIGGEIRHPEIGVDAPQDAMMQSKAIGTWVTGTPWAWPAFEVLHFIGLCLLFGIVLIVNMRVLGIVKNIGFGSLHRLLPFGIIGFLINSLTGMLFFLGTPEQYTHNIAFYWKVVLMLLAGVNVLYFTMFKEPWTIGPGDNAPFSAKFAAASAIVLWLGVMFCGRMLPYIGNSF